MGCGSGIFSKLTLGRYCEFDSGLVADPPWMKLFQWGGRPWPPAG